MSNDDKLFIIGLIGMLIVFFQMFIFCSLHLPSQLVYYSVIGSALTAISEVIVLIHVL